MPRHYWGAIAALIGLAGLAVAGWLLYEWYGERERSYQAAYQQYSDSKEIVPPGVIAEGERSIPDSQSYREEWRSERDLEAQRDMAEWALLMVAVSGLSVLVTSVGVVYVALTLRATRDAVKEAAGGTAAANAMVDLARDNAVKELRAYLSVEPDGINQMAGSYDCIGLVIVHNVGKLPASNVSVWAYTKIADKSETEFLLPDKEPATDRVIQPNGELRLGTRAPYLPSSEVTAPDRHVFVWGAVHYRDGYGEPRTTEFCHRYNTRSVNRVARGALLRPDSQEIRLFDPDKARYHTHGNDAD